MEQIDKAEVIRHMDANRAAAGGISGRFAVATDIKATAKDSGVTLDANDVLAWLPFDDVPAAVAALKKALAADVGFVQVARFDGTGFLRIGRRTDGIGVHVSPVRPATRGNTVLDLTDVEAEILGRALDVARHEIIGRFAEGEFL